MSSTAFPSATPAGWYQDPTSGRQRYWDGSQWTNHFSDSTASPSAVGSGLVTAGWITAFFMPLVGFVIGLVIMNRDKANKNGLRIVLTATGVFVLELLVLMSSAASSSSSAMAIHLVA
jgi:uncharacterized protein DUF2510